MNAKKTYFHIGENFVHIAELNQSYDMREAATLAYGLKQKGYAITKLAEDGCGVNLRNEDEVGRLSKDISDIFEYLFLPEGRDLLNVHKAISKIYLTAMRQVCVEAWRSVEPELDEEDIILSTNSKDDHSDNYGRFCFVYPKSAYTNDKQQKTCRRMRSKE